MDDVFVILMISYLFLLFCYFCWWLYKEDKERERRQQSFDDFMSCWAARQRRDVQRYLAEQERERKRLREQLSSTDEQH